MHSCIYEGQVRHRRYGSVEHSFQYSLFLVYLDLTETDDVFRGRWLWSTHGPAVARFCRDDHFGDPAQSLSDSVRDLVLSDTGCRPCGPIRLLTHLRYFGVPMNPVSFYFCFNETDTSVDAVVAEVNNTPWGERHCYVIDARSAGQTIRAQHAKDFHVSPFMPMGMQYRWRISEPSDRMAISIENLQAGSRAFDAALTLKRRPITSFQLARVLARYPLMTARVTAGIYWQALRLWWKGATYYPHPSRASRNQPHVVPATSDASSTAVSA